MCDSRCCNSSGSCHICFEAAKVCAFWPDTTITGYLVPSQAKTLGFEFGRSPAASVAQLGEHLALIQLLRDKMYRACESRRTARSSQPACTLILARHDKAMVSLLSSELAAGAFGRALAAIGTTAATGGPDPGALKQPQENVKNKAKALETAATADKPDKEAISNLSKELDAEVEKLVSLERQGFASAAALAATSAPGTINGVTRTSGSETVATIHQNYVDDDGLDPLIDA